MKKIFSILVICAVLLSACGGKDENQNETPALSGSKIFETAEFEIKYPADWEIIEEKDFTSAVPEGTLAAFRDPVKDPIFTANINVLKNELPKETPSIDYAKGLMQNHEAYLQNFKELFRENIDVKTGSKSFPSLFVAFEAKEKEDAEMKQFLQISVVKGKTAYLATAAYLKKDEKRLRDALTESLKSFAVK